MRSKGNGREFTSKMSNTFFTSDEHFGHYNILAYAKRPFKSLTEMEATLIERHNKVVSIDDEVIHLGDFSFDNVERQKEILSYLNGSHYIVKGNHDLSPNKLGYIGFEVLDNLTEIKVGRNNVVLCHYPKSEREASEDGFYRKRFRGDKESWILHGHVHDRFRTRNKHVNVGVDVWDYRPVHINTIRMILDGNLSKTTST